MAMDPISMLHCLNNLPPRDEIMCLGCRLQEKKDIEIQCSILRLNPKVAVLVLAHQSMTHTKSRPFFQPLISPCTPKI